VFTGTFSLSDKEFTCSGLNKNALFQRSMNSYHNDNDKESTLYSILSHKAP